jgi:hypothetical protein
MGCVQQSDSYHSEQQPDPADRRWYRQVCDIEERGECVQQREHECREHHPVEHAVARHMPPAYARDVARLALMVEADGIPDNPGAADRDPVRKLRIRHAPKRTRAARQPELTLVS